VSREPSEERQPEPPAEGLAAPSGERLARLDPDRAGAARTAHRARAPGPAPAPYNPRRLQWMAGLFAVVLIVVFSVLQLSTKGTGSAGVPAGKPLHPFAAPLATSTLVGDANLRPPCTAARHDPRAMNTCLLVGRGPLVLGFFVTDSGGCERAISAMQTLARRPVRAGNGAVQFAAVAVHASRSDAARVVRRHGWTIPVAYDRDGAVGETYGVAVCPLLELVRRGGIVAARLIGNHWESATALAPQVAALAR
jgi:hypothetical protein